LRYVLFYIVAAGSNFLYGRGPIGPTTIQGTATHDVAHGVGATHTRPLKSRLKLGTCGARKRGSKGIL